MNEMEAWMECAIEAAFAAGQEILDVYARPIGVEFKDDRSPLTEADKRAHASITRVLGTTGLPILSEEGRSIPPWERQAWGHYWLVDPLDGTKEFIRRNGEFTVNIALMARDGKPAGPLGSHTPVAGVIHVPVKDVLYFAWPAGGSFRQEQATTLTDATAYERAARSVRSPLPHMRETFTIVASRSHASPDTDAFIRKMEKEHGRVETVSMGSALKICLVAEGAADVYPRYAPTMEWDTAAGQAIVTHAGRKLIDLTTGEPMRYNKFDLLNQWFIVQ